MTKKEENELALMRIKMEQFNGTLGKYTEKADALFLKYDKLIDPETGTLICLKIDQEKIKGELSTMKGAQKILQWAFGVIFTAVVGVVIASVFKVI